MKKSRKILGVTLSAVALMAASAFGTLAYLTDTEAVTNTFTVGKVQITLDEAKVDDMGKAITGDGAERVVENSYKLLPGHTYDKDPTIHVDAKSENCYLFVKVENGIQDIETADYTKTIDAQMNDLGWVKVDSNDDGEVDDADNVYVLAKGQGEPDYAYAVVGGVDVEVFKNFTVDGDSVVNVPKDETVPDDKYNIADYALKEVKVTAYAVQAAGFDTSLDAWKATFGK